jgi:hypothetical protein
MYCYAECHYAEYRYTECHYAECRYAECRGALISSSKIGLILNLVEHSSKNF